MIQDKLYYHTEKLNDILDLQDDLTIEEIGLYTILKAAYFKYCGKLTKNNLIQKCKFFGDREKLLKLAEKVFEFKEDDLVNNAWLSEINTIKEMSNKKKQAANIRWKKEEKLEEKSSKSSKSSKEDNAQFEEFWDLYDYKKAKPLAIRAYEKAIKMTSHQDILNGVQSYIASRGSNKEYWKHPATWLNQQAWQDEYHAKNNKHNNFENQNYDQGTEGFNVV